MPECLFCRVRLDLVTASESNRTGSPTYQSLLQGRAMLDIVDTARRLGHIWNTCEASSDRGPSLRQARTAGRGGQVGLEEGGGLGGSVAGPFPCLLHPEQRAAESAWSLGGLDYCRIGRPPCWGRGGSDVMSLILCFMLGYPPAPCERG